MVAVTTDLAGSVHGTLKMFNVSGVVDEYTLTVGTKYPVKAWWYQPTFNPGTQTSAGANVEFTAATGVFKFHPGETNQTGTLFVVQSGL